ncbi:MAG: 2'-5' RNA ligase family protein [Microcoleaceae cyanobacterium]
MKPHHRLFFVALLPPMPLQERVTQIKQHFAEVYHSSHALKSPPHITLQPPFEWLASEITALQHCLEEFASEHTAIPVALSGFGSFSDRVIYIDVVRTPELLELQKQLSFAFATTLNMVDKVGRSQPSLSTSYDRRIQGLDSQEFQAGLARI